MTFKYTRAHTHSHTCNMHLALISRNKLIVNIYPRMNASVAISLEQLKTGGKQTIFFEPCHILCRTW